MGFIQERAVTTVWLDTIGSDRCTVYLEQVGPLFRVREEWYTPALIAGWAQALNPTWHLTYNGAKSSFSERVRNVEEASNID